MSEAAEKFYTVEEYLALEEKALQKSEYFRGKIYQMAGGSRRHNLICSNIDTTLNSGLFDSPCVTYTSDMRILVTEHDLYTYADASVVSEETDLDRDRENNITNPILLVEVLSKSTRSYDRGNKFEFYRSIPTLQYYLLADQDRLFIELYRKLPDGAWQLETFTEPGQSLRLPKLGNLELPLARIYSKVTFPARPFVPRRRLGQETTPHPDPTD